MTFIVIAKCIIVSVIASVKENKEIKVKKILGKSQANFWHYVKKTEAQTKKTASL